MFWLKNKKVIFLLCNSYLKSYGTLANREDPDEIKHNAAFDQGLHCLLRFKHSSKDRNIS